MRSRCPSACSAGPCRSRACPTGSPATRQGPPVSGAARLCQRRLIPAPRPCPAADVRARRNSGPLRAGRLGGHRGTPGRRAHRAAPADGPGGAGSFPGGCPARRARRPRTGPGRPRRPPACPDRVRDHNDRHAGATHFPGPAGPGEDQPCSARARAPQRRLPRNRVGIRAGRLVRHLDFSLRTDGAIERLGRSHRCPENDLAVRAARLLQAQGAAGSVRVRNAGRDHLRGEAHSRRRRPRRGFVGRGHDLDRPQSPLGPESAAPRAGANWAGPGGRRAIFPGIRAGLRRRDRGALQPAALALPPGLSWSSLKSLFRRRKSSPTRN
jgi:hypothetical protein